MRIRKSHMLAAVALAMLVSSSAFAWETRVLTLGDQNRFVEDDANIWLYPQVLTKYGERLYLDLNRKEGRVVDSVGDLLSAEDDSVMKNINGGMMLELTEGWSIAVWASDQLDGTTWAFLQGSQIAQENIGACGTDPEEPEDNDNCKLSHQPITGELFREGFLQFNQTSSRKFDLFTGIEVSEDVLLGFHLWWGNSSATVFHSDSEKAPDGDEVRNENNRVYQNQTVGFGAGFSMDLFKDGVLDVGLRYTNYSYELSENDVFKPTIDGGNRFVLDSRLTGRLSKHWWFVPSMQFAWTGFGGIVGNQTKPGSDVGLENRTTELSWTAVNVDFGLGLHMRVIDKASLFTATGIDFAQSQFNAHSTFEADRLVTMTRTQLPYLKTGFEAPLFDWLDLRAGFVKRWSRTNVLDDFVDPGARSGDFARSRRTSTDEVSYSEDKQNPQSFAGALNDFDTFVGATMNHRDWFFSVEVDPTLLFHGPIRGASYTPTGGGEAAAAPWFARFEISYRY